MSYSEVARHLDRFLEAVRQHCDVTDLQLTLLDEDLTLRLSKARPARKPAAISPPAPETSEPPASMPEPQTEPVAVAPSAVVVTPVAKAPPRVASPGLGASLDPLREIRMRVAFLDDSFTEDQDLLIVENLVAGLKVVNVAATLHRSPEDVKARWHKLCPDPTPDSQKMLLDVLRERAAA